MLRRKISLFLAVLLAIVVITPKNAYAGTCSCNMGQTRLAYLDVDNCDHATEYAVCVSPTNSLACSCVKKANSGLPKNECQCSGATVIGTNCQGTTPNALCEQRSGVCICSQYTSIDELQHQTPIGTTETSYNAFAGCSDSAINTALGCIPVDMGGFMKWLLPFLFGMAGGISFLLMVYGFILITLSKGDPKKVQGAKETITSAITGLLLSIFSLFILRLIITGILVLPGVTH